jgi:hypothetical protein
VFINTTKSLEMSLVCLSAHDHDDMVRVEREYCMMKDLPKAVKGGWGCSGSSSKETAVFHNSMPLKGGQCVEARKPGMLPTVSAEKQDDTTEAGTQ